MAMAQCIHSILNHEKLNPVSDSLFFFSMETQPFLTKNPEIEKSEFPFLAMVKNVTQSRI